MLNPRCITCWRLQFQPTRGCKVFASKGSRVNYVFDPRTDRHCKKTSPLVCTSLCQMMRFLIPTQSPAFTDHMVLTSQVWDVHMHIRGSYLDIKPRLSWICFSIAHIGLGGDQKVFLSTKSNNLGVQRSSY